MGPVEAPRHELVALLDGRAHGRVAARVIRVRGEDAASWLHDLVTADVASLEPGDARRSLLLTPTGRIRADVALVRDAQGFLLLQDGIDPAEPVEEALAPYVLSSRVRIVDESAQLEIVIAPAGALPAAIEAFVPAVLGPGAGAPVPRASTGEVLAGLERAGFVEAGAAAREAHRILRGIPRMGADFDASSLPAEAGLEDAIDRTKGCFLGQESVARVADLGHPPSVLRHVAADGDVGRGDAVSSDGDVVGEITSAARDLEGRTVAIARVRWAAREAPLVADGTVRPVPLRPSN
jgi:folate-binding protein YgfZ